MLNVSDIQRAMQLVVAAGALDHEIKTLVIDGEPMAKARARVGKGGRHYTPGRTADAERDIANRFRSDRPTPFVGNIAVAILFYRSNRHRVDVDNLIKTVLDGITKSESVWDDDDQVTALLGVLEYDAERPRTVISIGHHKSTMLRGDDRLTHTCETCGTKYRPHSPTKQPSRYCSRACRPGRNVRACSTCGKPTSHPSASRCLSCWNDFRGATS